MDARFKIVFLLAILGLTSLPLIGIINGSDPPPSDLHLKGSPGSVETSFIKSSALEHPINEEMVFVPAGPFIQGTNVGGYNERPERVVTLEGFWIDKYEVTNYHYQQFVDATGHRQPGPPSRYAKRLAQLRGLNQPVTYVSWADARAYCEWRGKRLPTEAEWEKAVRGTDGRLWPWGNEKGVGLANLGGSEDGYEATAPVGSFLKDQSIYGVYDGAGNLMEWVDDWYEEQAYRPDGSSSTKTTASDRGSYKTLRGVGYTSRGSDLRITNRMFMIADFRDETIGFRCATTEKNERAPIVAESVKIKESRNKRE